jgi:hypothetical protein
MMCVPKPTGPAGCWVITFNSLLPANSVCFEGSLTISKIAWGEALMVISELYEKSSMVYSYLGWYRFPASQNDHINYSRRQLSAIVSVLKGGVNRSIWDKCPLENPAYLHHQIAESPVYRAVATYLDFVCHI